MAFRFSPGKCNSESCGCGECTGRICVALDKACHAEDPAGVLITVTDHATGVEAGTATTDSLGAACVPGLPPGDYDVVAAKDGCFCPAWGAVALGCSTVDLTGRVSCLPYGARKFTITGCFGSPLPGAAITITGADSATVYTGPDGVAYYYYNGVTGAFAATASHDRFAAKALDGWTVADACAYSEASPAALSPSGSYQCCDVQKQVTPASPYPISKTLKLTDQGGATSFTADAGCGGSACATRSMDDAATCGGISCGSIYCPGSGGAFYSLLPPIGTQTCALFYKLSMSATTASLQQATPDTLNLDTGYQRFKVPQDPAAANGCIPDVWRLWRIASDCTFTGSTAYRNSTGYTINSLYPLNITFTFAPGTGWGPTPDADPRPDGSPYATSVVLSE